MRKFKEIGFEVLDDVEELLMGREMEMKLDGVEGVKGWTVNENLV
jgi:hypothetical protein